MTLSEFKGWFEERTNNIFKEYRYVTMSDINLIKEKLASVEDGNAQSFYSPADNPQYKEITCPCCDAAFRIMLPLVYKAHPGDSVPRPMAMPEPPFDSYIDAEDRSLTPTCHYCKNPLVLIMPPEAGVCPQVPVTGVCSVCHLYQP